jgi:hypothetical protein
LKQSKSSTDTKRLLSEEEFENLTMDEIRMLVMGKTNTSWKNFVIGTLGLDRRSFEYDSYQLYRLWWVSENTPLGKALK